MTSEIHGRSHVFNADKEERIDIFLAKKTALSRGYIQRLVEDGKVKVNGTTIKKKSLVLKAGDIIEVFFPPLQTFSLNSDRSKDFGINLGVIWEDENFLVLNKPAGVVVHPGFGHTSGTLLHYIFDKLNFEVNEFTEDEAKEGKIRPGIVHRLDKPVSGVMLVAKNEFALSYASKLFMERNLKKIYLSVCFGVPKERKTWEIKKSLARSRSGWKVMRAVLRKDVRAKDAITHVSLVEKSENLNISLFRVEPLTGRTHQIRVHLSSDGFPIVKDDMYGGGGRKLDTIKKQLGEDIFQFDGIFLHSFVLEIFGRRFVAPLPWYFSRFIERVWGKELLELLERQGET